MSPHSYRPYALPNGSSHPSPRTPQTSAHAPYNFYSDPRTSSPSLGTKRMKTSARGQSHRVMKYRTAIDILPNEILLAIFDHIRRSGTKLKFSRLPVWKWNVLTHVCRRWRQIVFASPVCLDLKLYCTYSTPVTKYLACWPQSLPIVVDYDDWRELTPRVVANVAAALVHHTRIYEIDVRMSIPNWNRLAPVMQVQFPALTFLSITIMDGKVAALPPGFLNGYAPSLRGIRLHGISTLVLPTLLSYARGLVKLQLADSDTNQALCIPPASLVASLAMLPNLKDLSLAFTSRSSQLPHPNTPLVPLHALTSFSFDGDRSYLEDFVARINAPRLAELDVTFEEFPDPRVPQLSQLISRTPTFRNYRFEDAKIYFDDGNTIFLYLGHGQELANSPISIKISSCDGKNHLVWGITQVLQQNLALLSRVARLEIRLEHCGEFADENSYDVDDIDWLPLLFRLSPLKTLHISEEFGERVARALEHAPEAGSYVLPALQSLCLEGYQPTYLGHRFAILQGHRPRPSFKIYYKVLDREDSESEESEDGRHGY